MRAALSSAVEKPVTDWRKHDGRAMPVPPETMVLIRYRNGIEKGPIQAKARRWEAHPTIGRTDWDIVSWALAPSSS
jgi:hypothetical protein